MYFPYFTILCLLHPAHRARRNTFFSDRQQSSDGHASRSPLSPPRRWSAAPTLTLAEGTVQKYFEFSKSHPLFWCSPSQCLEQNVAPRPELEGRPALALVPARVLARPPVLAGRLRRLPRRGPSSQFLHFPGTRQPGAAAQLWPTRAGNRASAGAGASACARRLPRRGPSSQFLRFPGTRHPGASARSPDVYDDSTLRLGPRGSQKAHPPPLRPPRRSLTAHLRSRADPPAPLRTLSRVRLAQGAPGASPAARAQHKRADRPRSGPGRLLQRARIGR